MIPETESELERILERSRKDFAYFVKNIFSESFEHFVGGQHIENTANLLGNHKKTIRVSARDHFKSTSLYAHFMWDLLHRPGLEGHYFSYNASMSAYHLGKIKYLVSRNPFYKEIIDLKPTAEGVLKYTWDKKEITTLNPCGLLAFKRGIHAPRIYVDDPLRDPDNKLNPTIIEKINRIFTTEVLSMLKQEGEMHVVGTPQTDFDFFFNKQVTEGFEVLILPAIVNWKKETALWPEYMPWEELMRRKRQLGDRVFNQEYLCKPVWTEQAWFSREKIQSVVNPELEIVKKTIRSDYTVLGWDVGKKVHPSHIAIFAERVPGHWLQIYQKFLDGMSYNAQMELVNSLCEFYQVDSGAYDATRGELESFVERRELHHSLEPIIFKMQTKHDMATNFEKMVENKEIELLNDRRMLDQILVVDNDLQSLETPEGHGDSFWSIAMALWMAGKKTESWDEPIR